VAGGRRTAAGALLAALLCLLLPGPVALAAPAPPTVDPAAPTPTAPPPGGPAQDYPWDGSTVGGAQLATRGLVVAEGAPPLPDGITAPGWLVADLGTGAVLAARDPHGRYYPASTLKTLTLLTLLHRLPADAVVTATQDDERVEGTRVGLVAGGQYPVPLLFRALILGSGNDVANALARAAGGSAATVAAMDATARSLGAFDTVAGTPSGLDVAGQSSSPYDLALVFRALVADPAALQVLATPRIEVPPVGGKPGFQVDNENPLLRTYPGDLGGKNGFTDAARHTFVTAADHGGRRIVVTLMGAERRPGVSEYVQAARLLDWGFGTPAGSPGVGRLVAGAETPAAVSAPKPPPASRARAAVPPARHGGSASAAWQGGWLGGGLAALVAVAGGTAVALRRHRSRPTARAGRATRRAVGR
jgi:D-alanyl-D-alanine carboxypeptidase (penicillin-binding protein 5/6)